jgi:hypothetical protein
MGLKELEVEIKKLDLKERATLAKWIVESLDDLSEAEIKALWVEEAAQYYESRGPGLGSDLLGEVERAFDQILTNPEASQRIGRRVRRKSLWRFPCIWYTRFIRNEYESLRSLTRGGDLSTGESG